ncbi:hypothetical protein V1477_010131 [Vespula maculifrons]|uniref:Uncharacterized protein n=1 Tax=Vespula maculifrons TaxID=7453 RepID=A0ABD2CBT2_VESMC
MVLLASSTSSPPSLVLRGTSERCRSDANDRLPASPAKTICNPTNRAQRLRDLSGSLAVRDINCFWLEPFTDRGPRAAAEEFRSPVKARSLTAITLYVSVPEEALSRIPSLYGGNLQGSVKRQLTRTLGKYVYYEEARFHVPRVSCKNRVHLVATIGNTRSCEHKPTSRKSGAWYTAAVAWKDGIKDRSRS